MKILVINSGSSSLKYQLIDMSNEEVVAKGLCERIAIDGHIKAETNTGVKVDFNIVLPNHTAAFNEVKKILTSGETKVIDSLNEISAIGHRIVQGGMYFAESHLVTKDVEDKIEELIDLAPLHNGPNLDGIRAAKKSFSPDTPHVVVFDNAFHTTMPPKAYMYAIPYRYYEEFGVRRYGFHGISHNYVSNRLQELHPEYKKVIICHLGNGSSITAIKDGKVIDTSMGLTPLAGLMMGSRSGDIDPSAVTYLMQKTGMGPQEMADFLNKQSGVLGITGISSDMREIENADNEGNERAHLALQMYNYRIKKYIGAYAAAMNGVDIIVWTAGVGENQEGVRWDACSGLEYLGVKMDKERNHVRSKEQILSADDSKVKVVMIPTDEEIVIARDTRDLVEAQKK